MFWLAISIRLCWLCQQCQHSSLDSPRQVERHSTSQRCQIHSRWIEHASGSKNALSDNEYQQHVLSESERALLLLYNPELKEQNFEGTELMQKYPCWFDGVDATIKSWVNYFQIKNNLLLAKICTIKSDACFTISHYNTIRCSSEQLSFKKCKPGINRQRILCNVCTYYVLCITSINS